MHGKMLLASEQKLSSNCWGLGGSVILAPSNTCYIQLSYTNPKIKLHLLSKNHVNNRSSERQELIQPNFISSLISRIILSVINLIL